MDPHRSRSTIKQAGKRQGLHSGRGSLISENMPQVIHSGPLMCRRRWEIVCLIQTQFMLEWDCIQSMDLQCSNYYSALINLTQGQFQTLTFKY